MVCVSRIISHYLALKKSLKNTLEAPVTIVELAVCHALSKNVTFTPISFENKVSQAGCRRTMGARTGSYAWLFVRVRLNTGCVYAAGNRI